MTARIAPSWMDMSTLVATSPLKPSQWPTRMRWPVEETGRNSVRPSTSPSSIASSGPHPSICDPVAAWWYCGPSEERHPGFGAAHDHRLALASQGFGGFHASPQALTKWALSSTQLAGLY